MEKFIKKNNIEIIILQIKIMNHLAETVIILGYVILSC